MIISPTEQRVTGDDATQRSRRLLAGAGWRSAAASQATGASRMLPGHGVAVCARCLCRGSNVNGKWRGEMVRAQLALKTLRTTQARWMARCGGVGGSTG